MAELADAPDLGSGGFPCRFNSCHPHQQRAIKKILPRKALIFQGFSHFYSPFFRSAILQMKNGYFPTLTGIELLQTTKPNRHSAHSKKGLCAFLFPLRCLHPVSQDLCSLLLCLARLSCSLTLTVSVC